jgi:hypothetical protein
MTKLLDSIISWFATPSQQSRLENYISGKNPTTAAEVDYWTRQYENNQSSTYWGHAR